MPELPEVETVVRLIRPRLVGRTIISAKFTIPRQLHPQTAREVLRGVKGRRIKGVSRRGKHILIQLETGILLIHLRMTGRLYVRKAALAIEPHERALFTLDDDTVLVLRDPRTLGTIRFFPSDSEIGPLKDIGVEPLDKKVNLDDLFLQIKRRSVAIKPLLLNQSLLAGIGNIYASEALWEASIDPRKKANKLTRGQFDRLILSIRKVMHKAIERGGTTLRNFADPEGRAGSYQKEFSVYDREDLPCLRCGKTVVRFVQAQRSTYFCKGCQK